MSAAVVLMAYGSPERLDDVPSYYADIRGGRPIAPEQLDDLVARYRRLGIEDANPLNAITEQTRAALEAELGLPVFTGMKHWAPRIAEAAGKAIDSGADTVAGLVLAPHYSRLSIAGYRDQLELALGGRAELVFVESWHDDPGFVSFLAARVRGTGAHVVFTAHSLPARILEEGDPYRDQLALALDDRAGLEFVESWHDDPGFVSFLAARVRGTGAHVVFTAHSLPARILDEGDPYRDQLLESSRLVAEEAAVGEWSFSFQSASPTGEPWLGPDILDHLTELHGGGIDDVLICPIGFVSDHLEIRWDLDTEARELAQELGMRVDRIEMPNSDPGFVAVLAEIVRRALAPIAAAR